MANGRFKVRARKHINIPRVVAKITGTVLALYVGGTIITEIGNVMNGTSSAFYKGLTLIGWSVKDAACTGTGTTICSTSDSGILAVVGIVGIAAVVMEFVEFRMNIDAIGTIDIFITETCFSNI